MLDTNWQQLPRARRRIRTRPSVGLQLAIMAFLVVSTAIIVGDTLYMISRSVAP